MKGRILVFLRRHYDILAYLVFGVLTTVVNFLVYFPCYNLLGLPAVVSNLIAWVAAVAFAYLTNKPFVFRSHDWSAKTVVPELVKFVGDRCAELGAEAPQLGLDFRFVCTLERHISAVNSEALRKILEHLLSNAYKFTPAGGTITVELRVSHGRVLLTVTDTGCGISEERLETLFDRYLHPQTMDLPVHGLGLGLPLCRRLAEAQGGALLAESRPGQGSRFTLSLPDRQVEGGVSDVPLDYMIGENGFNPTLEALADVLPAKAFLQRYLD